MVKKLSLRQPANDIAFSTLDARVVAERIGYPIVIRPSYVLGGRAMEILANNEQLDRYMKKAISVSDDSPILLDSYLSNAIEVDVDALSDGKDVYICGVMEHIEEAGVHSGDSACSLPPHSLSASIIAEIEEQTRVLALALRVVGLMNVQFAVKNGSIFLIEVNPRASRTVPFVAKATGLPIASIAAQIMAGDPLKFFNLTKRKLTHTAVKEAVLPFDRFPGVDTILSPEMRSTGEVMGLDKTFESAFLKAQLAAGVRLPDTGNVFISIKDADKSELILQAARILRELSFEIIATRGTSSFLSRHKIKTNLVNKVFEGRPNISDLLKDSKIQLVFNTTQGSQSVEDSKEIRTIALKRRIPYFTTAAGCNAAARAIDVKNTKKTEVYKIQNLMEEIN